MTRKHAACGFLLVPMWALLSALALLQAAAAAVSPIDPHALFDARCLRCHGHAGDFARKQLRLEGDTVLGNRVRRDIGAFLLQHQGRLTTDEASVLYDAFRRQLKAGGLFKTRCGACHRQGRELARLELIIADGRLIGRCSGRDMTDFLTQHGSREKKEALLLHDMLLWHRRTIEASQYEQ